MHITAPEIWLFEIENLFIDATPFIQLLSNIFNRRDF